MSKKRKRNSKPTQQQLTVHDQLIFDLYKDTRFLKNNIQLLGYNMYSNFSDRLYTNNKEEEFESVVHINPFIINWHNNTPSEIVYNVYSQKTKLVLPIKAWWITGHTEVVTIYEKTPNSLMYQLHKYLKKHMLPLDKLKIFFENCYSSSIKNAIIPTILNPQRLFYNENEIMFLESGHFQSLVYLVNENLRPIDEVYSHPLRKEYYPDNTFKKTEMIMVQSKVSGLLHFFHGCVTLLHYVLLGHNPVKNAKKSTSQQECNKSLGICKHVFANDNTYGNFFHRFYCVVLLQTLPKLLSSIMFNMNELDREFSVYFTEFIKELEKLYT